MSALYVYGLQDSAPRGAPLGLWDEPIEGVPVAGLVAAAGHAERAPPLEEWALRGHDAAVERLAGACEAFLPARFGTLFPGKDELDAAILPAQQQLREALALVRGCQQMTLRVYGKADPVPAEGDDLSGAAYLVRRARAGPRALAPFLEKTRQLLGDAIRGERVEAAASPPLLGSVYHLVPRGLAKRYLETLETLEGGESALRWTASGPWAPYAFVPEVSP